MTTKRLTHPDSKSVVETDNPEPYTSQGWVEKAEKSAPAPKSAPTPVPED